jgi:hypothetical protein
VHEAARVDMVEGPSELAQDVDHACGSLRPVARHELLERHTVEVFHREIRDAVAMPGVAPSDHVLVRRQPSQRTRFALEAARGRVASTGTLQLLRDRLESRVVARQMLPMPRSPRVPSNRYAPS